MRILVTGGNGQLGNEMRRCLETGSAEIGPIPAVYAGAQADYIDYAELDITDEAAVRAWFAERGPYDLVVNCAGYTNVDGCETNEAVAHAVNATAVEYLAAACAAGAGAADAAGAGAEGALAWEPVFVHISTDYVFPGTDPAPRTEADAPAPLSAYGRTKLAGEEAARANCPRSIVMRTAWLYGYVGKNFVKTMLRLGATRDAVTVVDDQLGNPTNANDLAYEILRVAAAAAEGAAPFGIYHCTGEGTCSWADFTQAIMDAAQLPCTVKRCTSAEYKAMNPASADRPAYSSLENAQLAATVGNEMRPWREALATYMAALPVQGGNPSWDEIAGK